MVSKHRFFSHVLTSIMAYIQFGAWNLNEIAADRCRRQLYYYSLDFSCILEINRSKVCFTWNMMYVCNQKWWLITLFGKKNMRITSHTQYFENFITENTNWKMSTEGKFSWKFNIHVFAFMCYKNIAFFEFIGPPFMQVIYFHFLSHLHPLNTWAVTKFELTLGHKLIRRS